MILVRVGPRSLKGFQTSVGRHPSRSGEDEGLGTSLTRQQGVPKEGKGKIKARYTQSTIINQTKGKGVLTLCSPREGKKVTSLKKYFQELEGEGEETDFSKKQRGVGFDDLTVEARSQPRRQ